MQPNQPQEQEVMVPAIPAPTYREHAITALLTLALIAASFAVFPHSKPAITAVKEVEAEAAKDISTAAFANIDLKAKAVYVYDINTGKTLYEKNADTPLPLASLTKLMTAVTASDLAPRSTIISIDESSLSLSGDSGLFHNERWLLPNLLKFVLISSSNDGAAAVASAVSPNFVRDMNKKAADLGLSDMVFKNESGLDVSPTEPGAIGSAKSVAALLEYAVVHARDVLEPTRYSTIELTSEDQFVHYAKNTDVISNKIPGLIGGKTGYTELAGGNLAVAFDAGFQRPVIAVVLGSTYAERFSDIEKLVAATLKAVAEGNN